MMCLDIRISEHKKNTYKMAQKSLDMAFLLLAVGVK